MDPNPESQLAWEQLLWEPRHRKDGGVTSQGQTGKLSRFLGVRQDWEGGGAGRGFLGGLGVGRGRTS